MSSKHALATLPPWTNRLLASLPGSAGAEGSGPGVARDRGPVTTALVELAAQAERDATMVVRGFLGIRARPYRERHQARFGHLAATSRTASRGPTGVAVREVEVVSVTRETADATTLTFRPIEGPAFDVSPGQFFTIEVPDPTREGATLRRAYSCSNDCLPGTLPAITVKRVQGGRVSNWLNDEARVGLRLRVLGPSGSFGFRPDPSRRRSLLFVAGGSGITPLMALTRTVLEVEPETRIALLYGSRALEDVIFFEALESLLRRFGDRFHVVHALETPALHAAIAGKAAGFAEGRLDADTFRSLASALPEGLRPTLDGAGTTAPDVYVCGPAPMMAAVRESLVEMGQPAARVHEESFLRPEQKATTPGRTQTVVLRKHGVETRVVVPGGKTLLEAGLAAGVDMPYSCAMGGCAACKVKLVEGEVAMEEPNCLGATERDSGFVLGCVARPLAPCVVEVP